MTDIEPQRHREHRDGKHRELTKQIIGAAIEVHRSLGPGLLESVYERCLAHEFSLQNMAFEEQKLIVVQYKGAVLDAELKADFIVCGKVIVELKSVDTVLPVHRAQILTYMKLTGCEVGLLIKFNVEQLIKGIERFTL
jgi:GxxExxY protein